MHIHVYMRRHDDRKACIKTPLVVKQRKDIGTLVEKTLGSSAFLELMTAEKHPAALTGTMSSMTSQITMIHVCTEVHRESFQIAWLLHAHSLPSALTSLCAPDEERSCTSLRMVTLNRSSLCSFSDPSPPLCSKEWQIRPCHEPHCSRCWCGEWR